MMKRLLFFMLMVFCFAVGLSAATQQYVPGLKRGFMIEGGVGKYNQINVSPIINTSNNMSDLDKAKTGVPFNLTDPSVAYTEISGGGRQIGTWSVATNYSNVKIKISATDLVCSADASNPIKYWIVFHIMYASFNEDGSFKENMHEDFRLLSGTEDVFKINNNLGDEPFPVVSYNQDIRVYLAEEVTPGDEKYEKYPYGIYESTVTIQVSGE
ncbi:MAG: hypothetical protein ACI4NM_03530 [Bullifex sp.]